MSITNLIQVLQASIAPVVLISGVGLLLLTMTNRLGRSIDRIRQLCDGYKRADERGGESLKIQIGILYQRCLILRAAILLAVLSIICVSIIIFALFAIYVFQINLISFVEVLFESSMLFLIFSLIFFLMDIWATLRSIKVEIESALDVKE